MRTTFTTFTTLFTAMLTACGSQQGYHIVQTQQKAECRKLPDMAERARCEKAADLSYERYRAEAEAAKPK